MPATLARCAAVMSGPMSVSGSSGSPTTILPNSSPTPATKSSYRSAATIARVAAVQSWPVLISAPAAAPWIAASRSASSKTTNGALPPSSSWVRCPCTAAAAITLRPTGVEPVNVTMSTPACPANRVPTSAPPPVTTLNTPSGRPASLASRASVSVVNGVISAGLMMTLQPAASAGITFHTAICSG